MNGRGRSGGRPTLEEVAARAGVGRGTVFRVVNGSSKVSERTRAAVEAAVAELGYVPDRAARAARALAGSRADTIALVVPEPQSRFFAEPYFCDVVRGVGAAPAETDVQLVLTLAGSDRERRRLAQHLSAHRVDAVLLVAVHAGDPLPELLAELGIPAVISGPPLGRRAAAVRRSRQRGGRRRGGTPPPRPGPARDSHRHRAARRVRGAVPARRLPGGPDGHRPPRRRAEATGRP